MSAEGIKQWHDFMQSGDLSQLDEMLADNCVFISPVVHTPQAGKKLSSAYLIAAQKTLGGRTFDYLNQYDCGDRAVLEFGGEIDGIQINGVDMIKWNADGQIVEFKVMVRPLKAVQKVHADMGSMLAKMAAFD